MAYHVITLYVEISMQCNVKVHECRHISRQEAEEEISSVDEEKEYNVERAPTHRFAMCDQRLNVIADKLTTWVCQPM